MSYIDIIIRDPQVLVGKPIIKGTRISVELILDMLSEGATVEDILKSYPHLTSSQIYAAIEYAGAVIKNVEIFDK